MKKIINYRFKQYNTIGREEIKAVNKVLKSGELSSFLGAYSKKFYGGKYVRKFEKNIEKYFGVKNAITVNSWTSGLIAAVGALDISPGDEIIVSPWTMCATATAILHWNAIPIFCDIDQDTFGLDYNLIESKITKKTKAIISVDIHGQSAKIDKIMAIARKYNLKVISDSAQAIGSKFKSKYTGTLSHIGGFSFNYHKHIHTGEGGVIITDDNKLAERMRLIRNHGEAVVFKNGITKINNILGHNFRLGEIEASIGIEQLKKLKKLVNKRSYQGEYLSESLKHLH